MPLTVLLSYRDSDSLERYAAALRSVGLEPLPALAGKSPSLDNIKGVVLAGGSDVDPQLYGAAPHTQTAPPDSERDAGELALIREALNRDLPLFAICRGLQILNVQQGGTLIQHLETADRHVHRSSDRSLPVHPVQIERGTLLEKIAETSEWQVNSRHHQAIDKLGWELRVSARDPADETIEAVERPANRFVLGVQWHPEDQCASDAGQRKLFEAFAKAVNQ